MHSVNTDLENLTLVVPTYKNKSRLKRTLAFISSCKFPHVIVLNGHKDDALVKYMATVHPEMTFIQSESGFLGRLGIAADLVTTDYVLMWADDEFWLPSFAKNAVKFLEANADYCQCLGVAVSFVTLPTPRIGLAYKGLRSLKSLGNSPTERLESRLLNWSWGGFWGVARTTSWRTSVRLVVEGQFPARWSSEIQYEASLAWQGGVRVLPELAWFRSLESDSILDSPDPTISSQNPLFQDWWKSAGKHTRIEFLSMLSKHLDLLPEDFRVWEDLLDKYCRLPYYDSATVQEGNPKVPGLLKRLWRSTYILLSKKRSLRFSQNLKSKEKKWIGILERRTNQTLSLETSDDARLAISALVEFSSKP